MKKHKSMNIEFFSAVVFLLTIAFMALFYWAHQPSRELKSQMVDGQLFRFVSNDEYWSDLTDYCVKDGYLFALYDGKGVLKIYDVNGNYKESFAYKTGKGGSSLYVDEDYVYLCDHNLNFYVISGDQWVDYIKYVDYGTYLSKLDTFVSKKAQRQTDSGTFSVHFASIFFTDTDGTAFQIVKRPYLAVVFQGYNPFIIVACFLLVLFSLSKLSKRKFESR